MPIARKTKSGSWTCVVDVRTSDGKRKQKRITVSDPSREGKYKCERLATQFAATRAVCPSVTVSECVWKYIRSKEKMLSPNTLRGYVPLANNAYQKIADLPADDLTPRILQEWMSDYAADHSPKTCANARSLLIAALNMQFPDVRYRVTLPQKKDVDYYTPTDDDVVALLRASDGELRKAILLSAFASLRRGEVCALLAGDLCGNVIHVSKSVAPLRGGSYAVKAPKNASSVRTILLPPGVAAQLTPTNGKIVDLTPQGLTKRFETLLKHTGLPHFRFHDLRAYSISARHALGIPDQYIIGSSGHSTDSVMKRVYRREMADKKTAFENQANSYFENLLEVSQKKSQSHEKVTK